MLSEELVKESRQLEGFELEDFKKIVNYCVNLILNRDNTMKLHQFITVDEDRGDEITTICLSLITALSKFRNTSKEFDTDLGYLLLSKDKKDYLGEKIRGSLYELRKTIYKAQMGEGMEFRDLEWRLEVEVGSRTSKNTFIPNVLLNFKTEGKEGAKSTLVNCDFAKLKNLHQSLLEAMKMHNSNKYKTARTSSI